MSYYSPPQPFATFTAHRLQRLFAIPSDQNDPESCIWIGTDRATDQLLARSELCPLLNDRC